MMRKMPKKFEVGDLVRPMHTFAELSLSYPDEYVEYDHKQISDKDIGMVVESKLFGSWQYKVLMARLQKILVFDECNLMAANKKVS